LIIVRSKDWKRHSSQQTQSRVGTKALRAWHRP
jgi:hypothetical protein